MLKGYLSQLYPEELIHFPSSPYESLSQLVVFSRAMLLWNILPPQVVHYEALAVLRFNKYLPMTASCK